MYSDRTYIPKHQRIVIKVGSSSLTHPETGKLDLYKMEILVRELSNLRNQNKDIILVSSGAVMVGFQAIGMDHKPNVLSRKQACASIGQARLMMLYQKLFSEYNQICSQILMTRHTLVNPRNRLNARNTFDELLDLGVIPVVNENDTVSTSELKVGDNDTLSAMVSALVDADLLVLLSDIDGLFTDDPHTNPDALLIGSVDEIDESIMAMAKGPGSKFGTGGMETKIKAAQIATAHGADMIICNGNDFRILTDVMKGEPVGTLFRSNPAETFDYQAYLDE